MHENAVESNHREHVFNFLLDSSYNFKMEHLIQKIKPHAPLLKLDLDTIEDYSRSYNYKSTLIVRRLKLLIAR